MNRDKLRDLLIGTFTGKVPNQLSLEEIKNGAKIISGPVTTQQMVSWVNSISPSSLGKKGGHYWLTVLLFLPIKDMPLIISHPCKHIREVAQYRLKLGK